ncbi:MAG: acetyl-CoA carboxylase biotin carboxylase subunit [Christensenellales bacterium]
MNTVLVANRGEIAVRIIRTCKKLGLKTVAVFSENDEGSMHTRLADYSVCIGPRAAQKSYLNINALIAAAGIYNADIVHPGVGFLAESAEFAQSCGAAGLRFVGPDATAMHLMGDKQKARQIMIENGFPVVPGSDGAIEDLKSALDAAEKTGFPLMIKAAKGGGGKGIRVINSAEELKREYPLVCREAELAFGDKAVYIEAYLPKARHIEVQVLADEYGNTLHLGTRECSLQRRNQKLIEEAPAVNVDSAVLDKMQRTAVDIAKCVGYKNAGTVEFLLAENNFYFMEMNTRIQVEHTVTECVYGVDLIKAQIQAALSHHINVKQETLAQKGHAIECRINAENVSEKFRPSPGIIKKMCLPGGYGVRVDTGFCAGDEISPFYDSMVLKLICAGENRGEAIAQSIVSLDELIIEGISHNAKFARAMLCDDDFVSGNVHTKWIEQQFYNRFFGGGNESV